MNQVSDRLHHVFKIQSQHKWVNKVSTAEQRIEKLLKLKAVVQSREDDLVQALHADLRKDEEGARGEATPIYGEVDQALAELSNWMTPIEADPTPFIGSRAKIMPESRGVVLLFSPWNYPFALLFQPLVSIIAAGNCALVKPNELAPHVTASKNSRTLT